MYNVEYACKGGSFVVGVLINVGAVVIGSLLGLLLKKGISKKYSDAVMTAVALCVVCIGFSGMLKGENILISIVSMVLGVLLGTLADIDGRLNRLGDFVSRKFSAGDGKSSVAQGFVTGSLLFCVGAMAIVGSLEAGLDGDNTMLITKSVLDMISAMMLSAALGVGVMLAAAAVLLYQGTIVLLSGALQPLFSDAAVAELTCVGSMMIFVLGFNMLGVTKIKIANFLPALIFAPLVSAAFEFLGKYIPALA